MTICRPVPIRKEFSFAKTKKQEKKNESSTDMSDNNIRVDRVDPDMSENLSEEQKNDFELSNTSSANASQTKK